MLIILSPAKTQNLGNAVCPGTCTAPIFLKQAQEIVSVLKKYSPKKLEALMGISSKLAALNADRFRDFAVPFRKGSAQAALLVYQGDVYDGLSVEQYTAKDFRSAQKRLRILSGLYGVLRPLDRIHPYRLEMKTPLRVGSAKNLYQYWKFRVSEALQKELAKDHSAVVINLASQEYAKVVDFSALPAKRMDVAFQEVRAGHAKTIALFAKRARGLMAEYIIRNEISNPDDLRGFRADGYRYMRALSNDEHFVFHRSKK